MALLYIQFPVCHIVHSFYFDIVSVATMCVSWGGESVIRALITPLFGEELLNKRYREKDANCDGSTHFGHKWKAVHLARPKKTQVSFRGLCQDYTFSLCFQGKYKMLRHSSLKDL